MTAGITWRQGQLVDFVRSYIADHRGVAPTMDEMAAAIGLKSKSGIARMIGELESRGVVTHIGRAKRSISIVEPSPVSDPTVALAREAYCQAADVKPMEVIAAALTEYFARHPVQTKETAQ